MIGLYLLWPGTNLAFAQIQAQTSIATPGADTAKVHKLVYGYIDMYYLYKLDKEAKGPMPAYLYNHNLHDELSINQAILGVKVNAPTYRAALGFHSGSYVSANYAGEAQPLLKSIFEASIGYKLKERLWVDAGVFSSYIGNETSISYDMWTLTRPIMAENYPYYQSGVKLTYEPGSKWLLSGLLLNGWQNIGETNQNKPLGAQIQYKPSGRVVLNASLFYGKEKAAIDTLTEVANRRSFFDFYGLFSLTDKLSTALYVDMGSQKITVLQKQVPWYGILSMLRYKPAHKWALCLRGSYYHDPYGVMLLNTSRLPITSPSKVDSQAFRRGLSISEFSINTDYSPLENMLIRIEAKTFISPKEYSTETKSKIGYDSLLFTSSIALKF